MPILRFLYSILLVAAVVPPAFADQAGAAAPPSPMPFERGTIEITVLGGVSLPVSAFRAKTDRQVALASLAIGRVMAGAPGRGNLELLVDVTPFFQIRQEDTVRGWSVAPLFVRWNLPPIGRTRVFAEGSGSLLFTTTPLRSTTFNYMEQAGFGVRIEQTHGRAWVFGYRFQHVSNGGRVQPNSGANFNFAYLGVSFLR